MGFESDFNVFGSSSAAPVGETSSAAPATGHKKEDTLSVADQEALATMMLAGYPILPPPTSVDYSDEASLEALAMKTQQETSDVAKKMLDNWSASIAKNDEIVREWLNSDGYRRQQADHANNETHPIFTKEFVSFAQTQEQSKQVDPLISNVGNYVQQVQANNPVAIESLSFGMVAFTAPAALSDTSAPYYRDILINANLPIQQGLKADLGLVGGIFSAGARNFAEASNTAQAISGRNAHSDKNLALNYGNRIVSLITDSNFDKFLGSMFSNKGTPKQLSERIAVFKMVLASTALMAIYSSEAKYISRGDFEGMVNGTTAARSPTEASLVAIFQNIRSSPALTESVYNQMIAGLGDYASKNPSFASFFKVDNAFVAIAERIAASRKATATLPSSTPI